MNKIQELTEKEIKVLQNNFKDINEFFNKNNCAPQKNKKNIYEYQLGASLFHIKRNKNFIKILKPLDKYNLL